MKPTTPTFDEWTRMSEEAREVCRLELAVASLEDDLAEAERRNAETPGTRAALVRQAAIEAGLTQSQVDAALDAYIAAAIKALKSGKDVSLSRLGKLHASRRSQRSEGFPAIDGPVVSDVRFFPAKGLLDELKE